MHHLRQTILVALLALGCTPKPTCDDGIKNGEESDVDCGGTCGGCEVDATCGQADDCITGSCEALVCAAVCGDSALDGNEACDDGGESAICDADCTIAECGDRTANRTAGEDCDDGGESASCDADCTTAECGDSTINTTAGEDCDDGGESVTCDQDCTIAECGDSTANTTAGEDCDDGGESASCDADCTIAECGDNTINGLAGEDCDDGGTLRGDGCGPTCLNDFVNGSFEDGDYSAWTLAEDSGNVSAGAWAILENGVTVGSGETVFNHHDSVEVSTLCIGDVGTGSVTGAAPDGTFTALQVQTDSEGHRMWQDITLSPGTTTLRWAQIYDSAGNLSPTSQFSAVHIRGADDDSILETVFITTSGVDDVSTPWTERTADISAYAGQTVRIDVQHQVQDDCFVSQWDNFRVE